MIPMNAIVTDSNHPLVLVLVVNAAKKLDSVSRLIRRNHQVICNRLSTGAAALFLENKAQF